MCLPERKKTRMYVRISNKSFNKSFKVFQVISDGIFGVSIISILPLEIKENQKMTFFRLIKKRKKVVDMSKLNTEMHSNEENSSTVGLGVGG